jgi:Zn-dependent M16 (insulinase) family peptidase
MTTRLHGFELLREQAIPELSSTAKLWRHLKTGAQLMSLENKDENKSFGIGFFTPPPSSNGMTHIMEHSVLCGSRKYPVKEPFIELAKSSLNTFLNAMTFPDITWYPVASTNLRDFYNLIDVYLDCVFFPGLPPHILRQEGWHYELEAPDQPLVYKGVVFNEMKGNYSSPDRLLGEYSQQALFPDMYYGYDSGGDPSAIPELNYADFIAYHKTYYHPSNAMIYFYGDDDPAERLRLTDAYLSEFSGAQPIDRTVPEQPPFDVPRSYEFPYDAGSAEEGGAAKAFFTLNWALPDSRDPELALGFNILQYILIGSQASPLRKALIDSGLGEGLTGSGMNPETKFNWFSTGLKGIAPESAGAIEQLIIRTLDDIAYNGVDPDMLKAAMNTTEFNLREANTGAFPRGLAYMFNLHSAWPYGFDPFEALGYEKPLNAIKARLAAGERYFEDLIQKYLLDNTHRAAVLLTPDFEVGAKREAAEAERLARAKAAMSAAEIEQVIRETHELKALQVTPDSDEALATIPTLKLADMERQHKSIPTHESSANGITTLYHDLPTNGIVYLDLAFEMHTLHPDQVSYMGLMRRCFLEMGTHTEDFVKLAQRIGSQIGGLSVSPLASMTQSGTDSIAKLVVRGKATPAQADQLLAILRDVLLTVNFDNRDRFRQILTQEKARLESALVPSGHVFAMTRLGASMNEVGWASEQMGGLEYLFFLRKLVDQVEQDWDAVQGMLKQIYRTLVNRAGLVVNVTLDSGHYAEFSPKLQAFLTELPTQQASRQAWKTLTGVGNEGFTIPAQVNYVAKGANLFEQGYEPHGSHLAILNYTGTTYLWERIRVQGGAYGGFNRFNPLSGTFMYGSYRDPNLLGTVQNYDGMAQFLAEVDLSKQELDRTIIGAVGELDQYQLPDAKGYTALVEHLTGQTDAQQQQERDELLSTSVSDFHRFGEVLKRVNEVGRVVVVGGSADIEAANAEKGAGWLEVKRVM